MYNTLPDGLCALFSTDTYYFRTKKLDKEYENYYKDRENINGKRIYAGVYFRRYVY